MGPVDHPADGAVQEGVNGVVKGVEGHKAGFVPGLHLLGSLLKGGKHAALAAGKVLAGGAVLAHLGQHFLQKLELIGNKGIGFYEFGFVAVAL